MMLQLLESFQRIEKYPTCIYEKGPQILTDDILVVEKLNATQQLTTMIIQPSKVNVMSNEESCFQCQEPGHIT